MSKTPIEYALSKIPDATKDGKHWRASCPGCESYTLVIQEEEDGGCRVFCTNGCDGGENLARLGLTYADLAPRRKRQPVASARGPCHSAQDDTAPSGHDDLLPAVTPKLIILSNVSPQPVRWLWPQRIPLGKLTMLVGDPSVGKSTLTADIAARVTTGVDWPDGSASPGAGGVVMLSAEDDPADTIRPRLDAAHADVSRIAMLAAVVVRSDDGERETYFSLGRDLPVLEDAIGKVRDCRMVVIDPISAYLADTDSHKNAAVRGLLAPLSDLAARYGVAVVLIEHLNKRAGGPAMYRPGGSIAFTAAARAVWSVSRSPDDRERRLMLPVKTNLARDLSGLAYTIMPSPHNPDIGVVAWSPDPVDVTADEALAATPDSGVGTARRAAAWLCEVLADGRLAQPEIERLAQEVRLPMSTLRRVKKALGVVSEREGFGAGATWYWSLPTPDDAPIDDHPSTIDAHTCSVSHMSTYEHLCDDAAQAWGEV